MIRNNAICLSLLTLALSTASVDAQDLLIGFGASSVAALKYDSQSPANTTLVGTLPNDFFGPRSHFSANTAATEAPSSSHFLANILVLSGLITMLCVGITFIGIRIARTAPRPRLNPA